ncbi:MAG TPA: XRE family transcriptional regulator, partial [Lachnospiraceae bacterium]|nr:XRE family transcriptional regulator [Lachnospiraceae bacterium]
FYICEYLDVTPSEFFDDGNSHPSEYREMQKDMEALDEKSRQNVLAIIKGLKR